MAIATRRHSVGDNSSNFFSAASYTLTWSIGNSALRALALFCAASSVGNTVFIRPSTSKPKPSVITRSARVMLRGCSSSGIVRGFFMATPLVAPSPSNHCPTSIEEQLPFARFLIRPGLYPRLGRIAFGDIPLESFAPRTFKRPDVIARFPGLDGRKDHWRTASSAAGAIMLRVDHGALPLSVGNAKDPQ